MVRLLVRGQILLLTLAAALVLRIAAAPVARAHSAEAMPQDFVYLRDVAPSIQQDMRYAGPANFTGRPVPGYQAPECVLVRQAAEALKTVQADLETKRLTLRVYDCYRPTEAVDAFVAWAKEPSNARAEETYYPNLQKSDLFPDYIATRSGHSRGATVDLTLARIGPVDTPAQEGTCTAPQTTTAPDGSLAMGTTFDCFDVKANTEASGLTPVEIENRALLRAAMEARGFKSYPFEWWHYTFQPEPYPDTYFDFPIVPRSSRSAP
jgi:zinc D-Ala-D-Ala dipeptidase